MFETLQQARDLLGGLAESRAVGALSGEDCVAVIHELGTIRRLDRKSTRLNSSHT